VGNALLQIGLHVPGTKSVFLRIINKHWNTGQPFATALLRHYVEGSGEPYDLSQVGPIPTESQEWIVKATGAKIGRHHLDPYHGKPVIPDLKNSLGHFDVIVAERKGFTVKTYEIEKNPYHFGWKTNDMHRTSQHGFELPPLSDDELKDIKALLPTEKYVNPGGFSEGFEIRKVHGKWTVYVPQEVAAQAGKPFKVCGRFER